MDLLGMEVFQRYIACLKNEMKQQVIGGRTQVSSNRHYSIILLPRIKGGI